MITRLCGFGWPRQRESPMGKPEVVKPTYVQLPATLDQVAPVTTIAGATIELFRPDGSRMRIHLEAGRGVEAAGIVAAFLGGQG